MRKDQSIRIALVGNPNTGKSLLFNRLTGLNQKVGNYPGITVEKKKGTVKLGKNQSGSVIDLPGTYSINPTSLDENIVLETLLNTENPEYPDVVVVVADVENLKRNLFLFSQIKDLQIPTILAINMADRMDRKGISLDIDLLKKELNAEVLLISARKNMGINELKEALIHYKQFNTSVIADISDRIDAGFFKSLSSGFPEIPLYRAWLYVTQLFNLKSINTDFKKRILDFEIDEKQIKKIQNKEIILRYQYINDILKKAYHFDASQATGFRYKLDKILTHKIFGYVIFATVLLLVFQAIFDWASVPMDFIDTKFTDLSLLIKNRLQAGPLTSLLAEGIVPGIGGIVIFIPQIAILFFLISVLEETGYMSRVVFLMDKLMRKFGMSGKSVIPLISGTACAIPAIMASRNIEGWKERLITILSIPFTTCSARLPVYAIIISLVIPDKKILGFLNLQGLTLMGLYLLGFAAAVLSGLLLNKILKVRGKSFFIIEMPDYKFPSVKNVAHTVIEKTKAFIFGAGKIILAISIVLWFLASNGPEQFWNARDKITAENPHLSGDNLNRKIASYKLENSYIGIAGKMIEPVIKPLGYDWKIGIALISSFAAREVFVSTLATIYSVGNDADASTIKERLSNEVNIETGGKRFNLPEGMSLLIFYVFAMQCMSTLAIVKKETNTWKWPVLQLTGMTALAYVASLITYTLLK